MPDSLHTINKDSLVHLSTPFSLSLQSGERHRSRVIFPDCQISNFHFFFLSGLGIVHDILKQHIFFFLPLFAILLVTNLVTLITCQHLSIFCFDYCQKFFFRIFNSFSQTFQFYTSWQLYLATQFFLVNPSRTIIDQYCHSILLCLKCLYINFKKYLRTSISASLQKVGLNHIIFLFLFFDCTSYFLY